MKRKQAVDTVYTASELAEKAGVSNTAITKRCNEVWAQKGVARKSGKTWLVNKEIGDLYIEKHCRN